MAKLNWNRPLGGYEAEPWRKSWSNPKKTKAHKKIKANKTSDYKLNGHEAHDATVFVKKYGTQKPTPVLWCLDCQRHICTLSWNDYETWVEITKKSGKY